MTENQLQDLKQFMLGAITQSEARTEAHFGHIEKRFDKFEERLGKVEARLGKLEKEFIDFRAETRQGFLGVGEAIQTVITQLEKSNRLVSRRLNRLEQIVL